MDIKKSISKLNLQEFSETITYQYIDVFKNPNKLPINEIHLQRTYRQLRGKKTEDFNFLLNSAKDVDESYFERKSELLPALDKRWVPKGFLYPYQPYSVLHCEEEKLLFLTKNTLFLDGLDYLLNCNYHQFWNVILYEPSSAIALKSFLLDPIFLFQIEYLESDYLDMYKTIFNKFLLVYEKLLTFRHNEFQYMPEAFGLKKLKEKQLLNLPNVIILALLYTDTNVNFVNKVTDLYFNDTSEIDFLVNEMETVIDQNLIILEMIGGQVCGFDKSATIVPIAIEQRPPVFSLSWVYSVVSYLHCTVMTLNILFHLYKPAAGIALNKNLPFRLPYIYVKIYRELYELLDEREESQTMKELFKQVMDEINRGRTQFVDLFHVFVSHCLDEALKHMGNATEQENFVEIYLKLLTTALDDEYFICDYNASYNVATQNEMFESCCELDPTRTQFITSCISKLPRHKKLQELSTLKRETIESIFRNYVPPAVEQPEEDLSQPGPSNTNSSMNEEEVNEKIGNIMDMFPHLGDGFVYQCLESYNFNTCDVINAILENNLPPHLSEISFDTVRIPPEPEPEKPILAYKGKKPDYDDALKLLNEKDEKKQIKNLVLEGIQYNYDHMYDDEYDDQLDEDVPIPVQDNPLTEETFNPNRKQRYEASSSEEEESEGEASSEAFSGRNKQNFCEDPAVLRERREARFRGRPGTSSSQPRPKGDVVGNAKGQGQDKNTLLNRQRKNANKSSRANHNRKGGAQWKRTRGMVPS